MCPYRILHGHVDSKEDRGEATDRKSQKFDDEAEYSGYKVDIVHDLDEQSPVLDYTPFGISDDEGE